MSEKGKKYIVIRGGVRVSDVEYDSKADADQEALYWKGVINRWPDGTSVDIVEKDEKKHRVW
jgi:hypothetical protein